MEEISSIPGSRKRKQFQSILKKPKTIHCPLLQDAASSELSIKDLRARRVFSPTVRDVGNDLKEEVCNGSDLVSGSGIEMCASVKGGKEKSPNSEDLNLGLKDVDIGSSNKKMKNEGGNQRNGSISSTTMVRKSVSRGKVYKSPTLFSYRRMLPFLTDMVKEEPSTKSDPADKDNEVDDSIKARSCSSGVLTDSKFGQPEHTGNNSNGTSPPYNGTIQNPEIQHEFKAKGSYDSDKGMPQNGAGVGLLNVEGIINDNGVTRIDKNIEDHIQTPPPDSHNISKVDFYNTDGKDQDSFLGCLPSGSKSSNHVPGPTQRSNTNSTTKQVFSPYSRSKIYASSSSFSYRRLLPFLMDVEKSSANNDPHPLCQNHVESGCKSDMFVSSDNKNEALGSKENQPEVCMEVQPSINAPSPRCLKQVGSSQNSEMYVSSDSKNKACGFQENQQGKCLEINVEPSMNAPSPQYQEQVDSIQSSELFVSLDNENEASGFRGNQLERCMEINVLPSINDTSPQCLKLIEISQDSELSVSLDCDFQENQQEKCVEVNVQPGINGPSPQCQKQVESSQSFKLYVQLDIENEACSFQENQLEKCMELNVQDNINAPSVDGSPHGVCMESSIANSDMSPDKPDFDLSEYLAEIDMLITGQKEMATPQKHAQLNEPSKIEGVYNDGIGVCDAEVSQLTEVPISSMPGQARLLTSYNQPVDILSNCPTELVCDKSKVDSVKSVILDQGSSESPAEGILKRNPRGCRGLCSCLNCSSFRLHAERAFEFSRNQMLDAKDVVLMLINELGGLRDSLEKSVVDGSDLPDIQLKQVRETCKKALAMEQVAQQRLSQMSEDLNAHCRTTLLQRPRVTFSRHAEVIAFPEQNQLPGLKNPNKQKMVSTDASHSHEDGSLFKDQQPECTNATS